MSLEPLDITVAIALDLVRATVLAVAFAGGLALTLTVLHGV